MVETPIFCLSHACEKMNIFLITLHIIGLNDNKWFFPICVPAFLTLFSFQIRTLKFFPVCHKVLSYKIVVFLIFACFHYIGEFIMFYGR